MKRTFTFLLTSAVLALGSATAQSDGSAYDNFDANDDGQIDVNEFSTYGSDLYNTFDANADGGIGQDEFGTGVYNLFDVNDDATLTESEFNTGVNTLYGGDYDRTYSDFDVNGNGEVNEAEFLESYNSSDLYNTFDADGSDQISEAEFNEGVFGIVDTNDDTAITEDEYGAAPLLFGSAAGTVAGGGVVREQTAFNAEDYGAFGDVQVGAYEPLEAGAEGGAISLAFSSPNEQNVDFNVTGPDGYREDFEVGGFGLETGSSVRVVEGLAPGVYSVAATDDRLQLIESKVEVREGEVAPLTFNMQRIEDFNYNLADYQPYGVYEVGVYEPINVATYGNLIVTVRAGDGSEDVLANINVTGPNDYRREAEGGATLQALVEGPYSVAATAAGYGMTEGKVEVRNGQVAAVTLTLEPLNRDQ